jgi:hypothetical protein
LRGEPPPPPHAQARRPPTAVPHRAHSSVAAQAGGHSEASSGGDRLIRSAAHAREDAAPYMRRAGLASAGWSARGRVQATVRCARRSGSGWSWVGLVRLVTPRARGGARCMENAAWVRMQPRMRTVASPNPDVKRRHEFCRTHAQGWGCMHAMVADVDRSGGSSAGFARKHARQLRRKRGECSHEVLRACDFVPAQVPQGALQRAF